MVGLGPSMAHGDQGNTVSARTQLLPAEAVFSRAFPSCYFSSLAFDPCLLIWQDPPPAGRFLEARHSPLLFASVLSQCRRHVAGALSERWWFALLSFPGD